MENSWMDINQTGSGSKQTFPSDRTCAPGKKLRGSCSVPLNNMFSQLLRLSERGGGQDTVAGRSGSLHEGSCLTTHHWLRGRET
jgi:hypothetical protein